MGRHGAPADPAVRLIENLPGWGLFATAVATGSVAWVGGAWPAAAAVATLGLGSTGVLWWTARRGARPRRRRGSPAAPPSPRVAPPEGHDDVADRRVEE